MRRPKRTTNVLNMRQSFRNSRTWLGVGWVASISTIRKRWLGSCKKYGVRGKDLGLGLGLGQVPVLVLVPAPVLALVLVLLGLEGRTLNSHAILWLGWQELETPKRIQLAWLQELKELEELQFHRLKVNPL